MTALRIATRGSLQARTQAEHVAASLRTAHPGLEVELVFVDTMGDRRQDVPLHTIGGQGVFVKEGESVKVGQLLVVLREKVNRQQLANVQKQRQLWRKRTALLADQLGLAALPAGQDESNRQLTLEKLEVVLRQKSAMEEQKRIRINLR